MCKNKKVCLASNKEKATNVLGTWNQGDSADRSRNDGGVLTWSGTSEMSGNGTQPVPAFCYQVIATFSEILTGRHLSPASLKNNITPFFGKAVLETLILTLKARNRQLDFSLVPEITDYRLNHPGKEKNRLYTDSINMPVLQYLQGTITFESEKQASHVNSW